HSHLPPCAKRQVDAPKGLPHHGLCGKPRLLHLFLRQPLRLLLSMALLVPRLQLHRPCHTADHLPGNLPSAPLLL
ncbi:unnamed protein product, partial [Closterium sp. NIES-54]